MNASTKRDARRDHILVADDDEHARAAIVEALTEDGHDVIGVEDGARVLEILARISRGGGRAPDLLALDVCMPGPSGIELLEGLRSSGSTTPVVIMTAFVTSELRARVERAGSAAVIAKPFGVDAFRASVLSASWKQLSHPAPSVSSHVRVVAERSNRQTEMLSFPTLLEALRYVEAGTDDGDTRHRRFTIFLDGEPVFRRTRNRVGWADEPV